MKRMTSSLLGIALAGGVISAAASEVAAQAQGVSETEVVLGSVNDLSGIFAAVGVPAVNGANLRFEEANANGGVHGRQIRFVVEDNGYQIPRAMQGYNKLLNRDQVFAMLLSLGTPMNIAGFKLLDPKGIPNVSPLTAARQMLQEPVDNKFIGFSSYYDQVRAGVTYLAEEFDAKEVCSMHIPSDFGKEIKEGTVDIAAELGLTYAAETTHKPDELDFVGSLTKLKAEGCDIVTMALGVRQGITVVGTAKKLGWEDVKFLNTSAGFLEVVAAVPGGVTDGLYAAAGWADLIARADDEAPAKFMADYEAKFGQPAGGFAMLGYSAANTVVNALEAAGPDLTQESFIKAMETLNYFDALTDTQITYGPEDHRGADDIVISVVENGLWKELSRK
ncbi:ABC transporter substrate-binding protein [Phaeobacter italicus]|uniref:ABC transporter substrate-binding protein n=1 Tax=Phaeobacter italicus TaxID=481446 RepID=UPI000186FFCB|nr:ABC transporter substrate-binding protein [Phaeobacter italicus]EEB70397.1 branched-chain amino acid ABC transporter, periplasmic substrate-binding protein [Ruegeria sp. R11]MBY6043872.1 ABC transporter substrate-binding protein [Phaeobacter italicus]MCA0857529.1 ABC transporter substrate-binding protein [Phaeobacter italicus]CRL15276.1 Leucine-, isoleucine-, valine-, threonine-, and alanine-binding protein precursor [Phaeobacter italicus]SFG59839.1 amino acid/amide ABC transporter substrat